MKFSIMIPVYNVEKYLEKCMLSIVGQSYKDYEIIVVIDGSTDGSEAIARDIKAKYPKIPIEIVVQENKGLGGARNTAMQYANGEYWLFVDSDDYLSENALEVLDRATQTDEYDLIYFNTYVVNEKGQILQTLQVLPPEKKDTCLSESRELLQTFPAAWNKLYKKTLFADGIRYQEKKWFEDLDVALKIYLKAKRILFIDDYLYNYVQRNGSIMSATNAARSLEMLDIFESAVNYFKEKQVFEEYYEELEYLAINKIMIFAMSRVSMGDHKSGLQNQLVDYMEKEFPSYLTNKYYMQMDSSSRGRVEVAARRDFSAFYNQYSRVDRMKQTIKYKLPTWATRIYLGLRSKL